VSHENSASAPGPVAVVTPFYNTERYLRECIESVLRQTWKHFTYVLVDNQSTDGSGAIAREYAAHDPRITLLTTPSHLSQRDNYNFAMSHVPRAVAYLKLVCADDWLYPESLARMIALAETDPDIALVGSYYLRGRQLAGAGLPYDRAVFTGAEIARWQLLEGRFFFGSPTAVLYRGSTLHERQPFYDPHALHEDTEACYEIIHGHKFGFVHQVLSYLRVEEGSISGRVRNLNPQSLDKLIALYRHGPRFLSKAKWSTAVAAHERRYYRGYVQGLLGAGSAEFVRYHRSGQAGIGYRLRKGALFRAFLEHAITSLGNPLWSLRRLFARQRD
jgi:glycosyltransferase involved in cell wall biosynthesis